MSVLLFQKTINFQFFPQKAEPEKVDPRDYRKNHIDEEWIYFISQ